MDRRTIEQSDTKRPSSGVNTRLSQESKKLGNQKTGGIGLRPESPDLIFLEGILPSINGEVMAEEPVEAQMSTCLDRLELMLANRGRSLDALLKVTIYYTDPRAVDAIDEVYQSRLENTPFPPRTVTGVCSLPGGAGVQVDVIAADS